MSTQPLQSDHWADQVAQAILNWQKENNIKKLHVDDMKTPSGRVHVGALRGVVLHDVIAKVLAEHTDQPITSTYVFNDMDSVDKIPAYLPTEKFTPWLGKPLYQTPAPTLEESGIDFSDRTPEEIARYQNAASYGQFYAMDFIEAFRYLGCSQEIVWSHELYESGDMDQILTDILDNVEAFKKIYREVADYELPENWYPFRAFDLRPEIQSTLTTGWDGTEVTYVSKNADGEVVDEHTVSPFGGTGKLLWKVDWPAHWKALGVTIEGAGKDHTSAGGSRDMANAQCDDIFDITKPYDIPYEWILIRGAKMSSSKGVGTSAREFVMLFPPAVGRFLFVSKHYNQVIDFDPRTEAIPDLFDEYDQAARIFWEQEAGDQRQGRAFQLSQIDTTVPAAHFLPRFRDVAIWMQHPEINLQEKFAEVKGAALTKLEQAVLAERVTHAQIWLSRYAPESYQLTPPAELPEVAHSLSEDQKEFVTQIFKEAINQDWTSGQDFQQHIFDTAKAGIGARAGFSALYATLIGKTHGPRAGWLILAQDEALLRSRLAALAAGQTEAEHLLPDLDRADLISINPKIRDQYPTFTVGAAVIRGVTIAKSDPELDQEKAMVLAEYEGLTTKMIGEFPELQAYREAYRQSGIDWHSRRPSPEALLRRVAQGKELYTINTLVDAYNIAVMRDRISVGAFDLQTVNFPTELTIAEGGEQILLLGDDEPSTIKAGEIIYTDQVGPFQLDINYRDAIRTGVQMTTKDVWINVEGVGSITRSEVEQHLQYVVDLITQYCGGTVEMIGIVK